MADQRVLDDENEKSTSDGAANERSHHDDMLGHILEDISLDEWEVSSESDAEPEAAPQAELAISHPEPGLHPEPGSNFEPADQTNSAESASLFSFAMMQKFGEEPKSEFGAESVSAFGTVSEPVAPEPPKAVGPNPFLFPSLASKLEPTSASLPTSPVAQDSAPASPDQLAAEQITEPVQIPTPASTPETPAMPSLADLVIPSSPLPANPAASAASDPVPAFTAPAPASTAPAPISAPTAAATAPPVPGKRKPAATLIFDSFTKSKLGTDFIDPFNLSETGSNAASNKTASPSVSAPAPSSAPDPTTSQNQTASKPRATARTLIFKKGMSIDGMGPTFEQILPGGVDPATTTGTNPAIGQNATTSTGTNPAIGQNATTSTGANPIYPANPSVGPNLAAAIAASNQGVSRQTDDSAIARHNSNVIAAHNQTGSSRPIARTMILKSLAPPEESDPVELLEESLTQPSQTDSVVNSDALVASGQTSENASGKPKFAKRSTARTLTFKAFTMPVAEEHAKPAPLKIVRYDSSKLRNLETNAKPLTIADSIAAAKQAKITAAEDKDDRRPLWLKTIAGHPLAKSPMVRSGVLLVVLSIALLVCSTALMKSLYSDGENYHAGTITTTRDQHHYRSLDGSKTFDLSDKGTILTVNGKATHGKVKNVSESDLVSLITAPPAKREIWLQRTDAGFVDQDGTILYGAGAPELQIAKKIDTYAALIAAKYKDAKTYPSDTERLERVSPKEFHYTNPFTGKVDQPTVQYKRFAAADATWTDHTKQGHHWADEPEWKPGAIHMICLDYCRLFIRGFDRNGNPLMGSTPGAADYVELKDGTYINPRRNDKIVDDKDPTPATFIVSRSSTLPMQISIGRQLGFLIPISLVLLVVAIAASILFMRRMKSNKADSTANMTKFTMK